MIRLDKALDTFMYPEPKLGKVDSSFGASRIFQTPSKHLGRYWCHLMDNVSPVISSAFSTSDSRPIMRTAVESVDGHYCPHHSGRRAHMLCQGCHPYFVWGLFDCRQCNHRKEASCFCEDLPPSLECTLCHCQHQPPP